MKVSTWKFEGLETESQPPPSWAGGSSFHTCEAQPPHLYVGVAIMLSLGGPRPQALRAGAREGPAVVSIDGSPGSGARLPWFRAALVPCQLCDCGQVT